MEAAKAILEGLKAAMTRLLQEKLLIALQNAHMAIVNQAMPVANSPSLKNAQEAVAKRFAQYFGANFDALLGVSQKPVNVLDYASLSLVEEDDLEAIIAMEGMIAHARNCDIPQFIKFNMRLDFMLFGVQIDESNNPMDPEQIGEAFKEAMRPVGLPAKNLLIAYRNFNSEVFRQLDSILEQANEYLVSRDVVPDLDVAARDKKMLLHKRNKQRQKDDPTERAFRTADEQSSQPVSSQDLFPLMQKLLHKLDANTATTGQVSTNAGTLGRGWQSGMLIGSKRVEVVTNEQLLGYLNELEARLNAVSGQATEAVPASVDLRAPLGDLLEEKSGATTLRAVDAESSDIIQFVTLMYEAIWRDETVPIPIKELIGRTQITTLKVALQDRSFFDSESHPVRDLLNTLANAGITWTQPAKLEKDTMYQKIKATILEFMTNFNGDNAYAQTLVEQFLQFKQNSLSEVADASSQLLNANERTQRLGEIEEYARRKINERILDKEMHPDVHRFLDEYFHKFLVQVILREGPGGISWRPVMNTIDVLLWTVQRERQIGDVERFVKVNTRLRTNLAKALSVAGIEEAEAESALQALEVVQDQSFRRDPGSQTGDSSDKNAGLSADKGDVAAPVTEIAQPELPADDEHLQEVDQYTIGLWFEFQVSGEQTIRCTLAAKIETIEKFVFVNSQGVKVIEKSRMGLARELQAGTVKLICDGPLIDRAMESVIAQLREAHRP